MVLTYPFILIVGWPRFWFHILVASDFFSSHQVMLGAGPIASSWWVAWVPGFWCALHGSKLGSGEGGQGRGLFPKLYVGFIRGQMWGMVSRVNTGIPLLCRPKAGSKREIVSC